MADVVGLDGSWVYDFAKQGAITNLTELMEADGYDDSQLSDQIQWEGNTYMIPVVNFAYPLYVNLDILEEAGVSEIPTPGPSSSMHLRRSRPIQTKQAMRSR
jgi:multiple sugar transport system substrate-binding protein